MRSGKPHRSKVLYLMRGEAHETNLFGRLPLLAKLRAPHYRDGMRGIDIKAIVLATLAVLGIDFVSGSVLFAMFADIPTNATEEQTRAAAVALSRDPEYLKSALILGTASTVVGGYLVARMARAVPYFNALAFALLGIVLALLISVEMPLWFMVVGFGLSVPAALFGAYLMKRQNRSPGDEVR